MRAITPGVKVMGGLLGIRACLLLIFVFVCAIDRSSTIGATTKSTTVALSFRRPGTLTKEQLNSAVTIEFDFKHIDRNNRTAVEIAYREVRRKILELLNRRKSTTASPTYAATTVSETTTVAAATNAPTTHDPTTTPGTTTPTTTINTTPSTTASTPATTTVTAPPTTSTTTTDAPTTTPTTTTETPTTVEITTMTKQSTTTTPGEVLPETEGKKRRRRNSGGNNDTLTEEDLLFIDNDHDVDENGNLILSLFIDKEGFGDLNFGELLHEAAIALHKSGQFEPSLRIRVNIYKGLPKELSSAETSQLGLNFWLPVLLASSALLLIFIFIFAHFWSSRNKQKGDALEREKLIPVLMG